MKKISAILIIAALFIVSCARDFDKEGVSVVKMYRDPANPCRVIVTQHLDYVRPFTAVIENCEKWSENNG